MITADLSGKKALVTGAASGIGYGTARLFAESGAAVAINDMPGNPRLQVVVDELKAAGLNVFAAPGDLSDEHSTKTMVHEAVKTLGGLDYLINNAGTPNTKQPIPPSDLDAQDEAFWDVLLAVNLRGPYRCVQAAAPYLKEAKGAIVSTASVSGFGGGGSSSVYSMTKAAIINMTKELARGLGPEVRVNAIAPGAVNSDWQCRFPGVESGDALDAVPLKRIGEPEDYAEAILFLCAGAGYITGHTLVVDGGLMA